MGQIVRSNSLDVVLTPMSLLRLMLIQYANLGKYGTFQLEISADDGTMTWASDLQHIDELAKGIQELDYHLHQSWTLDTDYATGEKDCCVENLGNHYDPYFAVRRAAEEGISSCCCHVPLITITHNTGRLIVCKNI